MVSNIDCLSDCILSVLKILEIFNELIVCMRLNCSLKGIAGAWK
jgi:hypothetical protein